MMNFKKWIESYKDINPEQELQNIQNINMTANLPLSDKAPLNHIATLTKGFHLNTIIGRMMQRWVGGLAMAPLDYTKPNDLKWRISKENKTANNNYKAAYDEFKQQIANAVDNLPYKTGVNVHSGKPEDVLAKSKEFFKNYLPENKNLIQSMNDAWNVFTIVFGNDNKRNYGQIQNFLNFYQIVKDEFLTIGEMLPTLGNQEDQERNQIEIQLLNDIQKEIDKYDKMLKT